MLDLKSYSQRVRLTDGVYGTEFHKAGLAAGCCAELLNIENPSPVEAIARSYVQAGSDVIMTNPSAPTASAWRRTAWPSGLGTSSVLLHRSPAAPLRALKRRSLAPSALPERS